MLVSKLQAPVPQAHVRNTHRSDYAAFQYEGKIPAMPPHMLYCDGTHCSGRPVQDRYSPSPLAVRSQEEIDVEAQVRAA